MNVRNAKKPKPRIDVNYASRFHLQTYGNDNLYPQHLQAITRASGTTELCLERYAKFVEGFGFANDQFADYEVNGTGAKADDVLHNVAKDITRFGGFALHVNYNVLCQITEHLKAYPNT